MIPPSSRVASLTTYVFAELASWRRAAQARGASVIDLSVGSPDGRPPVAVIDALDAACRRPHPSVHGYGSFWGSPHLRQACARWYQRRLGVTVDPAREVLPVLGSKEGLFHLLQAYLEPGDTALIPTPCYPAYLGAVKLAGATAHEIALTEDRDFRLRPGDVPSAVADAARLLVMNYPHNPTGAVAEREDVREAIAFARDHELLLISDLAYGELVLDPSHRPTSVLELPGGREQAVEFVSLSKSHSMAGWRIGFCVGNAEVVGNLARLKSNADFGLFAAVEEAAAVALDTGDDHVAATCERYRARRDRICEGLAALGWRVRVPRAGMYVWTRLPEGFAGDDVEFVRQLFESSGVLLTPGSAFGQSGRGYVRMSLVVDEPMLDRAVEGIASSGLLDG